MQAPTLSILAFKRILIVEPLSNGHIGTSKTVPYMEVSLLRRSNSISTEVLVYEAEQ